MQNLIMGANAPLPADRFEIVIQWPANAGVLDTSIYLTAASGKTRSDADMVFYNQPSDKDGCVEITDSEPGHTHVAFDLSRAPQDIEQIVACVTIEKVGMTMAAFQGTAATMIVDGKRIFEFRPELNRATEVAMRLVALYRRNGAWKLRADGQGFNDGLAPLARSFGIDVAEEEPVPERAGLPTPTSPKHQEPLEQLPYTQEPRRPAPLPVDDGSVTLSAANSFASWEPEMGEITVKLFWDSQCGGLQGRPRPLTPELGCFFELKDGRRGLVQSWDGNGQFDTAPYVHLAHVESDSPQGGQRLRINGAHWVDIDQLTLFAHLQADAPNWRTALLSLTASTAGQKPIVVSLEGGPDSFGIVALMKLENRDDGIQFSRLAHFATGHQEMDSELNWKLKWKTRYA